MADDVGIHCTVIPYGFSPSGKARLSLVLTPDTRKFGRTFKLRDWPEEITGLASKLVVGVKKGGGATEYFNAKLDSAASANARDAQKLWSEIFNKPSDGFATLRDILDENAQASNVIAPFATPFDPKNDVAETFKANQQQFKVKVHRHLVDLLETNWVQTRYLAEMLQSLYDDTQFLKLAGLIVAHETRMAMTGTARFDAQQLAEGFSKAAAGALGITGPAWINALASVYVDRPFRQTLLAGFRRRVLKSLSDANIGVPPGDAFGVLAYLSKDSKTAIKTLSGEQKLEVYNVLLGIMGRTQRLSPQGPPESRFVQSAGEGRNMMRGAIGEIIRQQTGIVTSAKDQKRVDLQLEAAQNNLHAYRRHWRNNSIGAKDVENLANKSTADQLEEAVRRKFFGIRSQPTLAKFLRLIVDVEVEAKANLTLLSEGDQVTACFPTAGHTPPDAEADFFAYEYQAERLFRPRGQQERKAHENSLSENYSPPIRNGVVDLSVVDGNKDSRFQLLTLNLANSIGALRMQSEQNEGAQRDGTLLDTVSTKLPERQARGLQLIDHGGMAHMVAGLAMGRIQAATKRKGDTANPYFAEDLAIGYRPYVQRWKHGALPVRNAENPWRSLVARTVSIARLSRFVEREEAYQQVRQRDHGLVRVAHKLNGEIATTDGQMFDWMGASLAMSTELQTTASVGRRREPRRPKRRIGRDKMKTPILPSTRLTAFPTTRTTSSRRCAPATAISSVWLRFIRTAVARRWRTSSVSSMQEASRLSYSATHRLAPSWSRTSSVRLTIRRRPASWCRRTRRCCGVSTRGCLPNR